MTTDGIPVLIDFGSARQRLSERSMTVVESAGYTPFEQLQSRGNVGPWSDLYALGCTLVRVITGKTPPKAMDRMRKDPFLPMAERAEYETKLSRRFCQSIDQALSVDEEKRWQDAREWLAALRKNALVVTPQVFQAAPVSSPVNIAPTAARASNQATHRPGEERDFDLVKGCKIRMCWIPPGEFWMGSSTGQTGHHKDENQHRVRISKGFWLAQTQTTQAQWQAVMGNNPSHFKGQDLPVETVSWSDIVSPSGFIEKVNRHSGTPDQFSLPTEAQWEYACRSGKTGAYAGNLDQMAWYEKNSGMKTHPVAGKSANAWGLYDMHGNVWEWCSDWYGAYSDSAATDPKGSISGALRVFRGGGWYGCAEDCRVAYRGGNGSTFSNNGIGFRVARSSVP
jgi:formylglycine-generating enzyme required for sulfatase activity